MAKFPLWVPATRGTSLLSDYIDRDWGWFDYPGNELDMFEEGENLVIHLRAPGFKKDDFEITVESGTVTITGSAEAEELEEDKKRRYFQREIQEKSFTRKINLPFAVKSDEAKAKFEDGILKLTLPKSEEAKPKSIEVSTS